MQGIYYFNRGYNIAAVVALLCGIIPNVPGFLTTTKIIAIDAVPLWFSGLYHYAWFVGFAVSFVVYYFLMKRKS